MGHKHNHGEGCKHDHNEEGHHRGHMHGKSSFDMLDSEKLFNRLDLQPGSVFADLCCGTGVYSLHAAKLMGPSATGKVYAVDLWEQGVADLKGKVGKDNGFIVPLCADVANMSDIPSGTVDLLIMVFAFHDLLERDAPVREMARILKKGGRCCILEWHGYTPEKRGPPKERRIEPKMLTEIFEKEELFKVKDENVPVGKPQFYLNEFVRA